MVCPIGRHQAPDPSRAWNDALLAVIAQPLTLRPKPPTTPPGTTAAAAAISATVSAVGATDHTQQHGGPPRKRARQVLTQRPPAAMKPSEPPAVAAVGGVAAAAGRLPASAAAAADGDVGGSSASLAVLAAAEARVRLFCVCFGPFLFFSRVVHISISPHAPCRGALLGAWCPTWCVCLPDDDCRLLVTRAREMACPDGHLPDR